MSSYIEKTIKITGQNIDNASFQRKIEPNQQNKKRMDRACPFGNNDEARMDRIIVRAQGRAQRIITKV